MSDQISKKLIEWWIIHGRIFSWRASHDPYNTLIAEVMLQRTKTSQVERVFSVFIDKYPTLELLSKANINEMTDILKPLGLNWRIRLIIDMLSEIMGDYGGRTPASRQNLIYLSGVGDYVASAVSCFAFGNPEIIVDINTLRVISRLCGFEQKGEMRRRKGLREVYQSILDSSRPREFNYALLDLAAKICTQRNKRCESCPKLYFCKAASDEVIKLEKSL